MELLSALGVEEVSSDATSACPVVEATPTVASASEDASAVVATTVCSVVSTASAPAVDPASSSTEFTVAQPATSAAASSAISGKKARLFHVRKASPSPNMICIIEEYSCVKKSVSTGLRSHFLALFFR